MDTFITRSVRNPRTGMMEYIRTPVPTKKVETMDDLYKQIDVLKNALLKQEELRSENKNLKEKLAEVTDRLFKTAKELNTLRAVTKPPTKKMLLEVAPLIVTEDTRQETIIEKCPITGKWVEKAVKPKKPYKPRKAKDPTTLGT